MKKKYMLLGVAGVLVGATVIGGTMAALNVSTENGAGAAEAEISLRNIGAEITGAGTEMFTTDAEGNKVLIEATPGGYRDCKLNVTNSATSGYDVYVKVDLYHYFEDRDGEYMALADMELTYKPDTLCYGTDKTAYDAGVLNTVTSEDWLLWYQDEEQVTLFYTKPVSVGASTTDFLDGIDFAEEMNNTFTEANYNIEIDVTAVQANNSEDAIAAELGVFPTFDEEGNITAISATRAER